MARHFMECCICGAVASTSYCETYGAKEYCEFFCNPCYWAFRRGGRAPKKLNSEKKKKILERGY